MCNCKPSQAPIFVKADVEKKMGKSSQNECYNPTTNPVYIHRTRVL